VGQVWWQATDFHRAERGLKIECLGRSPATDGQKLQNYFLIKRSESIFSLTKFKREKIFSVIPAKAGIHCCAADAGFAGTKACGAVDPRLRGDDGVVCRISILLTYYGSVRTSEREHENSEPFRTQAAQWYAQ
jgi:hypothetical protein